MRQASIQQSCADLFLSLNSSYENGFSGYPDEPGKMIDLHVKYTQTLHDTQSSLIYGTRLKGKSGFTTS